MKQPLHRGFLFEIFLTLIAFAQQQAQTDLGPLPEGAVSVS